ncbi:MAG: FtsW/RodA/SpoVE family cell cycle protein [Thermoanaerobaculaceae bacterium]|nr:FtsW/RodA/SpoVE family cell cycle protein [Thermoanaerobaculaceae bacterium]
MPLRRQVDRWLLAATFLTAFFGVAMVASASAPLARDYYRVGELEFALRQLVAVILGGIGLVAATFVPLERLTDRRLALPLLALTWLALVVALFQPRIAGTHRWLHLPIGSIQPSTLAKVTLPLALASWLAGSWRTERSRAPSWGVALTMAFATVLLVLVEPDLGSAVLILSSAAAVLFVAGMPRRHLLVGGGAAAALIVAAVVFTPYRLERVRSFLGTTSYQVQQSLIALGGGGVFGRGPGQSVQKLFYLPQPHSDFIFAILGEEFGLIGTTAMLALFGVIVARAVLAVRRAATPSHALLALGLATTLAVQVLLNVSVCLNLLPAKGLPLPLVSAGGSDVLMTMVAIGLILNVAKEGV